jgi:transposase, IS6 family
MTEQNPFKWRHFQSDIILLCVRWHLRYPLSSRDLEEIMLERGLHVDHTSIYRLPSSARLPNWRSALGLISAACNDSWRVDETSIKIKTTWTSLYRAVDSQGHTIEFFLSPTRDTKAAKRFFLKALHSTAASAPQAPSIEELVAGLPTPTDPTPEAGSSGNQHR